MRLVAYGLLLVLGLKAHSIGRLWHQGVQEFIALSTLVASSPAEAAARACGSAAEALCQVRITSAQGEGVCELSKEQLARRRRFQLALRCRFIWLPGVRFEPSVSAENYRLTLASRQGE